MSDLNNIEKKNPFKVPENYFEQFNAGIMDKLPEKESSKKGNIKPLWKKIVPWSAVAAMVAGVVVTIGIFNHGTSPTGTSVTSSTPNIVNTDGNKNGTMLASSADVEDFYMFLEDEAVQASYYDSFYIE